MLSWIPELNIILHSIASSVRALLYVIVLMFAFFWHCAVAGVFMFGRNDPQHFGMLYRAFLTLIQVSFSILDYFVDIIDLSSALFYYLHHHTFTLCSYP